MNQPTIQIEYFLSSFSEGYTLLPLQCPFGIVHLGSGWLTPFSENALGCAPW